MVFLLMNLNVATGQHSHRDVWHTKPCSLTTTLVRLCFGVYLVPCTRAHLPISPYTSDGPSAISLPFKILASNGPGQWVPSEDGDPIYCVTVCFTDTCLLAKTQFHLPIR